MRAPFSYSGGKQRIAGNIIALFPNGYENLHYVEPFAGSLSVLLRKKPSRLETASDSDKRIYTFFKVIREKPEEIKRLCLYTPYGKNEREAATKIYKNPKGRSEIDIAWAFWIRATSGFRGSPESGTMTIIKAFQERGGVRNQAQTTQNRIRDFHLLRKRIMNCQLLNEDAFEVIRKIDTKNALFYLDPPYPETSQEYKNKFSLDDFNRLIETLKSIKGRFILSFYEKEGISLPPQWKIHKIPVRTLHARQVEEGSYRIETLALNY